MGFFTKYKDKQSEIVNLLQYTIGLHYLNPLEVNDSYASDLVSNQPENSRFKKYMEFLLDAYVDEESDFPPAETTTLVKHFVLNFVNFSIQHIPYYLYFQTYQRTFS